MAIIDGLNERHLTLDDIEGAIALSEEAGWNQTARDWQLMLENGLGFGLVTENGSLVATALTLPHGCHLAWVSMVLVTKAFGKRGLTDSEPLLAHSFERVMPGRNYVASVRDFWRVCSGINAAARERVREFLSDILNVEQ